MPQALHERKFCTTKETPSSAYHETEPFHPRKGFALSRDLTACPDFTAHPDWAAHHGPSRPAGTYKENRTPHSLPLLPPPIIPPHVHPGSLTMPRSSGHRNSYLFSSLIFCPRTHPPPRGAFDLLGIWPCAHCSALQLRTGNKLRRGTFNHPCIKREPCSLAGVVFSII